MLAAKVFHVVFSTKREVKWACRWKMCDTYFLVILQVLGVTLVLLTYILTFFFCTKFVVAIENASTSTSTSNGTTRTNRVSFLLAAVVFYILSKMLLLFLSFIFLLLARRRRQQRQEGGIRWERPNPHFGWLEHKTCCSSDWLKPLKREEVSYNLLLFFAKFKLKFWLKLAALSISVICACKMCWWR